jgi:hypothetical protein
MVNGVVLEVNGTFWHCDRRVYPNGPQNESQIRTAAAYGRKMELMKRRRIKVVEIWEKDIDASVSDAVNKALEECND